MAQVAANQLDMTDAQKAVFLSYTAYALAGLNASIELNCAWQASVGLNFNIAFPDGVRREGGRDGGREGRRVANEGGPGLQ
jgi:hypothetical protein